MSAVLDTHSVLWYLENSVGLFIAPIDAFVADAVEKIPRSVVPDMPDRIIAETAFHLGVPLITATDNCKTLGFTRFGNKYSR